MSNGPHAQVTESRACGHCTTLRGSMAVGAAVLLEAIAASAARGAGTRPAGALASGGPWLSSRRRLIVERAKNRHEGRASLDEMTMTPDELATWRKSERERLIAAREALDPATVESLRRRIEGHLERSFPGLAAARLGFCWPIRNEYDARPLMQTLRDRGAITALPVVVAPRQPLVFREWHPGVALADGLLRIPYPASSDPVIPTVLLLPMNGWDGAGYRLGYGAGFFDRTLASMKPRPIAIGVGYELSRIATIHPQ